jgi:two-component system, OmpR family, response regulator VicR
VGIPVVKSVLIVEDETKIRQLLRSLLERDGLEVLSTSSGAEAIELARSAHPDLMLLDLRLPDVPGEEVAREVRAHSSVPIVMLTAKAGEDQRILGLELGADDYVTKPFSPREVVARVRAVLRRSSAPTLDEPDVVTIGDLEIDGPKREVRRDGDPVKLTRKEFDLLHLLASNPGRTFTRSELLEEVWDFAWDGDTNTVTVHVRRLREKIEDDPSEPLHLVTVWGVGYRLDP